ncbi:MAG: hypothetical protein U1F76_19790 [Candidatus Competibacteraceae bacterium]
MNIWKKGPLTTNPYYETAFQALGITRDVTARAEIDQKVGERRQAVTHVPGYYRLGKRALTPADVTTARQILFDPTRRMLEELLEHQPESLPVEALERFRSRLPMPPDWPETLPPPQHLRFLLLAVQEFALEYLNNLPPVEVPPFPVNLDPIPPFGLLEEETDNG